MEKREKRRGSDRYASDNDMDGHSPTCSGSRPRSQLAAPNAENETRPEVAQDETQINAQPPTIIDHRAVRDGGVNVVLDQAAHPPPLLVSGLLRTAADICANVGDIKPWMIGFLLSAKVNDSNKGRTRAADRMYRKEKKAKSTAACACMGPWPTAPYHLEIESSQWLQTGGGNNEWARSDFIAGDWLKGSTFLWARRRTQKRCAQFHGSDHTRNITAGRSMTAEKGVEEPGRGAGESWWCGLADWTGGLHVGNYYNHLVKVVMTLTRILPPLWATHLIHRPGGRWIRYGMLLCGTVRSNTFAPTLQAQTHPEWKGLGPQRLAACLQIDGARPLASLPMIGLSVHYASTGS
ncbi:hypothetical protein [truncated ORF], partial [Aspergillus niger]|uniref:Uncharacterized protein n=2 Tax=Aspergillus niger TaxID=5061 RepID=A0AAJ8BRD5_ASPNG